MQNSFNACYITTLKAIIVSDPGSEATAKEENATRTSPQNQYALQVHKPNHKQQQTQPHRPPDPDPKATTPPMTTPQVVEPPASTTPKQSTAQTVETTVLPATAATASQATPAPPPASSPQRYSQAVAEKC